MLFEFCDNYKKLHGLMTEEILIDDIQIHFFLLYVTKIIIKVFNNLSQPQWEKTHSHLVPTTIDSYNVYPYLLNRK